MALGDKVGLEAAEKAEEIIKAVVVPELELLRREMTEMRALVEKVLTKKVVLTFEDK